MADILDEKITLPASQTREPLSFEVDDVVKWSSSDSNKIQSSQERYTYKVETHPLFSAGTYTLRDIIDKLSKCAHIHNKTVFTGNLPQSSADCNCNCDCTCGGDDGG